LIGVIVVILGIAAIPEVSYPARAGRHGRYTAKSAAAKAEWHKKAKKCKTGQVRKNGKCVRKGSASGSAGKDALKIVWDADEGFSELNYTMNCDPASGTLPDPVAACAEISRHPGMVVEGAHVGGGSCPPSSSLSVSGEYEGRAVEAEFSPCGAGSYHYQQAWEHLLPTGRQENEVSIDRAVGPFALGETRSSVEALLARAPAGIAGGLYLYHPWDFRSARCGRDLSGGEPAPVLALRYDRAGHAVTVIGDQNLLTMDGQEVSSLLVRCPHGETEDARSAGALNSWVPVTCAGREAFADHPLSKASTMQDTTIVIPAGEADQFPLVIVTSDPISACEDAARLPNALDV
jgi:hypothetical protein